MIIIYRIQYNQQAQLFKISIINTNQSTYQWPAVSTIDHQLLDQVYEYME